MDARSVPPTAVTHGHEAGNLGLKRPCLALRSGILVSGLRHIRSAPAWPQSPVAARTVTPIRPSFRYSRHCLRRYSAGNSASSYAYEIETTFGATWFPQSVELYPSACSRLGYLGS